MELCNCSVRDIYDYTEDPLQEKEIAIIARETLKALEYMHSKNFIHRDIKGANILLTEGGEVKLGIVLFYFFWDLLSKLSK